MRDETTMMDVLGSILSRLVNVALFIVISILALMGLRTNTDLHLGLIAGLAVLIGVAGAFLVRLLFRGLLSLGSLFE